jgi:hypothetical protein
VADEFYLQGNWYKILETRQIQNHQYFLVYCTLNGLIFFQ